MTISEIIGALVIGIPSLVLGLLAYLRSLKVDEVAEEAGTVGQAIEGLNTLVARLQEDNTALRADAADLRLRIKHLTDGFSGLENEVRMLKAHSVSSTPKT